MNKCIDLVVAETPLVKKKHRRARSGARHFDGNVPDGGALCVLFHMEMFLMEVRYVCYFIWKCIVSTLQLLLFKHLYDSVIR